MTLERPLPAAVASGRAATTQARRSAILRAALESFTEVGFAAATIQDIQRRSGASNGSIFHHFGSKEQIARDLYDDGIRSYQKAVLQVLAQNGDAEAGVRAIVCHHFRWVLDHPDLARFMFLHWESERGPNAATRPISSEATPVFFPEVTRWLDGHIARGAIKPLPFDVCYVIWNGPIHEFARYWLAGRALTTPEDAQSLCAEAAWLALRAAPAA